ncbi:MAG TPA: hypothetical protein VFP10_15080, partial [Candidatus Eisenbacteria bacterium]|nr:hypothetical protein [Candidatus Eisenbacteria bacterium]
MSVQAWLRSCCTQNCQTEGVDVLRNSSLLSTLCLLVPLAGNPVPEAMAEPPVLPALYAATVKIAHSSQEVLVRSVQNRLVVEGVDLAEVKWMEVRGPKSAVRTHSLTTETAERFIASVTLTEDFEGPASIAIGFSDNSERVLSESLAVVDPLVEAVFTPIDEKGDRVPPRIPVTDELISRIFVLAIQCPGPSVPFLNWVDATSVAPP